MLTTLSISSLSTAVVATVVGATLGGIAVVALILLLITRELTSAEVEAGKGGERLEILSRYVLMPIVPLLAVFAIIVAVKVWEVL